MQEFIAEGLTNKASYDYMVQQGTKATGVLAKIMEYANKVFNTVAGFFGLSDIQKTGYADLIAIAHSVEGTRVSYGNKLFSETADATPTMRELFDSLTQGITRPDLREAMETIADRIVKHAERIEPEVANMRNAGERLFVDMLTPDVVQSNTAIVEAGFNMDAQEALVHQLYTTSTQFALEGNYHNAQTLRNFYEKARKEIKPERFLPTGLDKSSITYAEAKAAAQDKWDSIFSPEGNVRPFLANFAALAVVNEEMQGLLANLTPVKPNDRKAPISEQIKGWTEQMMDKLNRLYLGSGDVPKRVQLLSKRINAIKTRRENIIDTVQNGYVATFDKTDDKIKASVAAIAKAIRGNRFITEQQDIIGLRVMSSAFASVAGVAGNAEPGFVSKYLYDLAITSKPLINKSGKQNEVGNLINEVTGGTTGVKKIRDLKRRKVQHVDTASQHIRDAIPQSIADQFEDLTPEKAEVIQRAMVQTDISALVENGFTLDQVLEMMANPEAIQQNITDTESGLRGLVEDTPKFNYYANQAEHLGKYMVTGQLYINGQMPNAIAIAEMLGVESEPGKYDVTEATKQIDTLASLYALKNTDHRDIKAILEIAEIDKKGLNHIVTKHSSLKNKEKAAVQGNGAYAQTKGASFDVNDPNASYKVVKESDLPKYRRRGYIVGRNIKRDKLDRGEPLYEVYSKDGGSVPWLQGTLTIIDNNIGGVNPITGQAISGSAPNYGRSAKSRNIHKNKLSDARSLMEERVYSKRPVGGMIASFSPNGNMNSYRYVVPNHKKDRYHQRNTEVNQVFAYWEARITEEQAANVHNENLIRHLNEAYDRAPDKRNYIKIEAGSDDKQIQELYKLIPQSLKLKQRELTGSESFYVHPAEYNNAMGYRQKSMVDLWESETKLANTAVQLFELAMGNKAASYIRRGERGLQELVSTAKDFVIIRSVIVPFFNLVSNVMSLGIRGVKATDMLHYGNEGLKAARDYKSITSELIRLKSIVVSEDTADNRSRIAQLELILKDNPINELVTAGLMPTVVEDLGEHDDLFSIQGGLMDKFEQKVDKLPQSVRDIGKEALITKKSKVYGLLNEATEMGDFVSKYILYKHSIDRKGMDKDDAMQKAANEFVDYGALSGRTLDYLNSIGLTHFFKYFLRIQSVLFSMVRDNPSRVLMVLGAGAMGSALITPFDGAVWDVDLGFKSGWLDMLGWFFTHPLIAMLP